jgi:hypothetical protein
VLSHAHVTPTAPCPESQLPRKYDEIMGTLIKAELRTMTRTYNEIMGTLIKAELRTMTYRFSEGHNRLRGRSGGLYVCARQETHYSRVAVGL